jgi:8-oxo-dGTP pyrophosphatase MutT (NUDIX family)
MPTLADMRRALAARPPVEVDEARARHAAVAVVLHDGPDGPEMLFIERAERAGDPWSGHMAFPGGRAGPSDAELRHAAERETLEEVGVRLPPGALVGRLDDLRGNPSYETPLVIAAFVYALDVRPPLALNYEVREAFWVPVDALLDPLRRVAHEYPRGGGMRFPGILVGLPERHVVWGLTYRFLVSFFEAVGCPLPDGDRRIA